MWLGWKGGGVSPSQLGSSLGKILGTLVLSHVKSLAGPQWPAVDVMFANACPPGSISPDGLFFFFFFFFFHCISSKICSINFCSNISSSLGGSLSLSLCNAGGETPPHHLPVCDHGAPCSPHQLPCIVDPLNNPKFASGALWAPGGGTYVQPQNTALFAFSHVDHVHS